MRLILQRHLAGHFILPIMVSLIFFVSFLLTFELLRLTTLLMSRDISLLFLMGMVGELALTFIPLALPLAVFFATVYCLNKLCTDSEYVAMRAAGLSKSRIFMPFLLISLMLASSILVLGEEIIPYTNRDFRRRLNFLTSSGLIASIREGQFFTAIKGITLFPTRAGEGGRGMKEVLLHVTENDGERVIMAKKGDLIYERQTQTMVEKLTLHLQDGSITGLKGKGDVEKVLFRSYFLPLSQNKYSDRISPKETMLNGRELKEVLGMTLEQAEKAYNFDKRDQFNAGYEFWNRLNTPLLCLLLTLVGFGLGVREGRGKGRNSAAWGLAVLVVFYGLFFGLVGAARGGQIPVWLAMLIPDLALLGAGIFFYKKLDWNA